MAEMPTADFHGDTPEREFWRDLKPIEQVFRPGALPDGTFDVFDYIALCRKHYDEVGIGSAYVDGLIR